MTKPEPKEPLEISNHQPDKLARYSLFFLFGCTFAYFLWLNRIGFSLGYFSEDFQWLYRMERSTFTHAILPSPPDYFRPLSVNLPYFIFSHLPRGLLVWKITTAAIFLLSFYVLWRWLQKMSGNEWAGLFLASLWLFQPPLPYGLFFANAFDYVLLPALLIFTLHAIEIRKFSLALLMILAACFAKEMALAFPLFFLLYRRQKDIPWRFVVASVILAFSVLLIHQGFQAGRAGGFAVQTSLADITASFHYLGLRIFTGGMQRTWYLVAWGVWIIAFFIAFAKGGLKEALRGQILLLAVGVFFFPLPFLKGIFSIDLGPPFWTLILGCAAHNLRYLPKNRNALVACIGILLAAWLGWHHKFRRTHYADKSAREDSMLEVAEKSLKDCGVFDHVVVKGLDKALKTELEAEHALWGLMRLRPTARFHLLAEGPPVGPFPRKNIQMWVSPAQAEGHPQVHFHWANEKMQIEGPSPPCLGAKRVRDAFGDADGAH